MKILPIAALIIAIFHVGQQPPYITRWQADKRYMSQSGMSAYRKASDQDAWWNGTSANYRTASQEDSWLASAMVPYRTGAAQDSATATALSSYRSASAQDTATTSAISTALTGYRSSSAQDTATASAISAATSGLASTSAMNAAIASAVAGITHPASFYNSSGALTGVKVWIGTVTTDSSGNFSINYTSAGFTSAPWVQPQATCAGQNASQAAIASITTPGTTSCAGMVTLPNTSLISVAGINVLNAANTKAGAGVSVRVIAIGT